VAIDLNWELTILEIVQGFYLNLLRDFLEDEVTPPRGLEPDSLHAPGRDVDELLAAMRRWLKLLDMAITPELLRHSLTVSVDHDLAESLLRYYARKQSKNDFDRDKTDFVATFLYRNPRVPGQWDRRGVSMDGVAPVPPFEIALIEILDEAELPELNREESRMLDEFEFLSEEVENFCHFDQLMDSGLMQRVRHFKHTFGPAFYHPHALGIVAPYNYRFGCRFGELFSAAAIHIKSYAEEIQIHGGSLSARVEGDITVQHLTQIEEQTILGTEYRRAQDHLRHVSKLKKAVDSKSSTRPRHSAPPEPAAPVLVTSAAPAPAAAAVVAPQKAIETEGTHAFASSAAMFQEETRIRSVEESIRGWVRAAEERCRHIVPMKFGNFLLSLPEADAYCAEFHQEKSFRGDNARALVRMVAIMARIQAEGEEWRLRQNSAHLWRPHADALALLQQAAVQANENAMAVMRVANQRGLTEKAKILSTTMDRLRTRVEQVRETLALGGPRPDVTLK
jgi:hypothetical protein